MKFNVVSSIVLSGFIAASVIPTDVFGMNANNLAVNGQQTQNSTQMKQFLVDMNSYNSVKNCIGKANAVLGFANSKGRHPVFANQYNLILAYINDQDNETALLNAINGLNTFLVNVDSYESAFFALRDAAQWVVKEKGFGAGQLATNGVFNVSSIPVVNTTIWFIDGSNRLFSAKLTNDLPLSVSSLVPVTLFNQLLKQKNDLNVDKDNLVSKNKDLQQQLQRQKQASNSVKVNGEQYTLKDLEKVVSDNKTFEKVIKGEFMKISPELYGQIEQLTDSLLSDDIMNGENAFLAIQLVESILSGATFLNDTIFSQYIADLLALTQNGVNLSEMRKKAVKNFSSHTRQGKEGRLWLPMIEYSGFYTEEGKVSVIKDRIAGQQRLKLEKREADLVKENDSLKQKLEELKSEYDDFKQDWDAVIDTLNFSMEKNNSLKAENEELKKQLDELRAKEARHDKTVNDFSSKQTGSKRRTLVPLPVVDNTSSAPLEKEISDLQSKCDEFATYESLAYEVVDVLARLGEDSQSISGLAEELNETIEERANLREELISTSSLDKKREILQELLKCQQKCQNLVDEAAATLRDYHSNSEAQNWLNNYDSMQH